MKINKLKFFWALLMASLPLAVTGQELSSAENDYYRSEVLRQLGKNSLTPTVENGYYLGVNDAGCQLAAVTVRSGSEKKLLKYRHCGNGTIEYFGEGGVKEGANVGGGH